MVGTHLRAAGYIARALADLVLRHYEPWSRETKTMYTRHDCDDHDCTTTALHHEYRNDDDDSRTAADGGGSVVHAESEQ